MKLDLNRPRSPSLVCGSEDGTVGSKSRTPRRVKELGKAAVREKVVGTDQDPTSDEEESMAGFGGTEQSHDLTSTAGVRESHDPDVTMEEELESTADKESTAGIGSSHAETGKNNARSVLGKRRKRERYMAIAKKLKVCMCESLNL